MEKESKGGLCTEKTKLTEENGVAKKGGGRRWNADAAMVRAAEQSKELVLWQRSCPPP